MMILIRINSTGKHNGLKTEWTANNIAPKYVKENLTGLKIEIDQES